MAADAQFTPKTVETKDERAKLMFRVKLKIESDVLQAYYTRVKTGIRGVGYVRTSPSVAWPSNLEPNVPMPKASDNASASAAQAAAPANSDSATPAAK